MRQLGFLAVFFLLPCASAQDQDKLAKRYGFDVNLTFYPQKTPQEAILSVVKAAQNKRIDYLLAHLADPRFVDDTVAEYKNSVLKGSGQVKTFLAFDRLVTETRDYFLEDPTLLKGLRLFGKEAEFDATETQATGTLKTIQGRKVFLRKLGDRWFLENKQQ
jgi:hypothetical protein